MYGYVNQSLYNHTSLCASTNRLCTWWEQKIAAAGHVSYVVTTCAGDCVVCTYVSAYILYGEMLLCTPNTPCTMSTTGSNIHWKHGLSYITACHFVTSCGT